jgi:murein hydrolase activator
VRLSGPGAAAAALLLLTFGAGARSRAQAPELAPPPAAPVSDRDVAESSRQLAALRERIQAHRERAAALADRERDAAARLRNIEEEIGLVRTLLGNLDARERILQQRSDTLRAALGRHQTAFGRRRDDLARRLRALYVRGPRSDLEAVLTANSYTALVARLKYATLMSRLDRRLLDRTREQSTAVMAQEAELRAALSGIWEAREEARRERSRLEEIEAERQEGLRGVRQERQQVESSLAGLEANARRLTDVLSALENRRLGGAEPAPPAGAPAFGEAAGRLPWPVDGPVLRPYGRSVHPEFKTVTVHNGIAIGAPLGAAVRTVAAGTVVFVDRLPGYGQCVIVDHGDGFYSLYAHAARVFVARGDQVASGQVVAEVGEPEGGGKPQLYFEIRRGRTPVDPLPWLRAHG